MAKPSKTKNLVKQLNIIDLESTCWEGDPPLGQKSEIIEIGIVVVDLKPAIPQDEAYSVPRIESKRSILVKPRYSKVSKFCTKLTTITQEMLDKEGIPFEEALQILRREYDSRNRAWASWGDYDRVQFERNCSLYQQRYPFGRRHTNIKTEFAVFNQDLDRGVGVSKGLETIGEEFKGTQHRGHDDAEMIAKNYIFLIEMFRKAKAKRDHYLKHKDQLDHGVYI